MRARFCIVVLVWWGGVARADDLQFFLPPSSIARPSADRDRAAGLFQSATESAKRYEAASAYRLVFEALHFDEDFEPARKLLGYVRFRDHWHTPFEVRQLSAGKVWTDRFGWLPQDYAARYANGERFYRGRWMTAENESKLRASISQGWRVESEHYSVLTNHSLEAGVELSQRLERLHAVWSQLFAGYLLDDAELMRRFDGKPPRSRGIRQHEVMYYRTRDEYNTALRKQQPRIDMTLGIYFDDERTAYFFAGDDQDAGTLWHEATHQLFSETRPTARDVGRKHNFWTIEAVACYMESVQEHLAEGYVSLGEPDAGRMPAARQRLLQDSFYVPLAELVAMGMNELQADPRIAKIYSQSAGLATFFLEADAGKYREPFVTYLRAVYDGRADENTLSKLLGRSYSELDAEYREWMQTEAGGKSPAASDGSPVGALPTKR